MGQITFQALQTTREMKKLLKSLAMSKNATYPACWTLTFVTATGARRFTVRGSPPWT